MEIASPPNESSAIHIGSRIVGEQHPCCIVFEAGATHTGLESAIQLVDLAASTGADAIKFQILDPDRLVADKAMLFTYDILLDRTSGETESVSEPLYDILCRRVLSVDEWHTLKARCDELNLAFFATALSDEDIALLEKLGCHSIKIASGDVNHFPLIRRAARTGMCIQLDTGNATIGEIEAAVDVTRSQGNENIIIHQCPSGYPARLESINLNIIPTLRRMFRYPVAYSDHSPGWDMDVAAVALGANLVEKTITLDRTTRGCEHMFSLEPDTMAQFVTTIRQIETALGTPRRILHDQERQRRTAVRRAVHLPQGASQGQRLGDVPVDFRRPGTGIAPDLYETLVDLRIARDVGPDHKLRLSDLTE